MSAVGSFIELPNHNANKIGAIALGVVSLLVVGIQIFRQELSRDKFVQIIDRLRAFDSMTWSEILVRDKKNYHVIPTDDLVKKARECLEEAWQDGVDRVLSLRLTDKERTLGILDSGIVHLL